MSEVVIQVENLSKQYRLGEVSTGSLHHDINRWWHRVRGLPDPYLSVTGENIRTGKAEGRQRGTTEGTGNTEARKTKNTSNDDYVWALRDINFEVKRGEVLGIIGRNGAGKSTLLKILSRITAPTTGEVRVKGRIASLLEVGTGFHQDLTGRENIYLNGAVLGMTRAEIAAKLDEIVEFSGCARYLDTPVKRYSSGMVVRLGFAVAAHLEPEILIVDEVLAVGDLEFQKKCIGKMESIAGEGRTILLVSHNMLSIKELCKNALCIDQGNIVNKGLVEDVVNDYLAAAVVHSSSFCPSDHQVHTLLQVESVSFGSDETVSSPVISFGSPLNIRLKVTNGHAQARRFKMAIELSSGGACFSTLMSPAYSIESNASQIFCCTVPAGIISPGLVTLNVGLVCLQTQRMADLLRNIASVVISPIDQKGLLDEHLERGRGFVYLPTEWK